MGIFSFMDLIWRRVIGVHEPMLASRHSMFLFAIFSYDFESPALRVRYQLEKSCHVNLNFQCPPAGPLLLHDVISELNIAQVLLQFSP